MINKLAGIFILSLISFVAVSQTPEPTEKPVETKPKTSRPDIPGSFMLEFGINRGVNPPEAWKISLFNSRTFNVYYTYDVRIMKSKFSFVPGIGLSLERFYFTNDGIIKYPTSNQDSILLVSPDALGIKNVKKSLLVTNFIEVPLEFRFSTNPDDPTRSFKFSLGGRIGYLYDSFAKYKYKANSEVNLIKEKHNFNLNRFRYGLSSRIGIGNFSIVGYYNLNTLFEKDKGLYDKGNPRVPVNFNTYTIAISLASF